MAASAACSALNAINEQAGRPNQSAAGDEVLTRLFVLVPDLATVVRKVQL